MFRFHFEDFGSINKGEVNLNNLTIFCGGNNTGKTYVSYVIYDVLKSMHQLKDFFSSDLFISQQDTIMFNLDEVLNELDNITNQFSTNFSKKLYQLFSVNIDYFKNSSVRFQIDKEQFEEYLLCKDEHFSTMYSRLDLSLDVSKPEGSLDVEVSISYEVTDEETNDVEFINSLINEEINDLVFDQLEKEVFLLPAERSGLNLFYKELNENRNELFHELGVKFMENKNKKISLKKLSKKINPYAKPISDYLSFLNSKHKLAVEPSDFEDIAEELMREILNGTYKIVDEDIYFVPISDEQKNKQISLHVASSTAKTLFGLVFYLQYVAEEGQYLIIDEPELNLHPDNQRKLARILAKLSNRGIHVVISTHSDYIIKEFNNLLLLSNEFESKEKLMNKYGYQVDEILQTQDVSPYVFVNETILPMEMTEEGMIQADTFNQVINQYNDSVDDIYFTLQYEMEKQK